MAQDYSEDKLIEQTCISIFKDQLNWDTVNVYEGEVFSIEGTLGRTSEADVLLKRDFLNALKTLNPDLPDQAYANAFETINEGISTKVLGSINFEKYQFLRDGIPVTYKDEKGEIVKNKRLKVFNFGNPEKNRFLAVQQLWVEGRSKRRRRPDIVCFVNGIPLVFIELKAHHRKLRVAYEDNFRDYKDTIPHLFHCNALVILSNGIDSKVGAITSKYEHFNDWKRIEEDEEGVISLDTIIKGTCDKVRLLDLFENFILFDSSPGKVVKLIAKNHQYIGVNKAIRHFSSLQARLQAGEISAEDAQKLGVFWHTQGSGKSYSMVFLCQKINRQLGGSYTFLIVTDRKELDKQIYGTFAGVGAVTNKKAKASSGDKLKELLGSDEKYIFTLIHKFNFEEVVTQRTNIIVVSDEAHRTQGGTLALNMRKVIPNASFIGFTGTPLFKDDELTKRLFGDYVSVYDFKRSVEDGATVPLYYENRGEKLKLDNPKITEQIRNVIESFQIDSDQEEKLKTLFAKEYPILTAEKRLRSIAKDVVEHFNTRGYKGKAMMVVLDKVTAVRMYNFITEEWQIYLAKREKEIERIDDLQEQLTQEKEWHWSKETEIAVVISGEQNEIAKFQGWGLDIESHRLKMNERDLDKEFKDDDNPFRLAIVCAMWITGFDVPSLSTLYLDKPLKTHTLMQTIARANRVYDEQKNNGLVVDYIETYKSLLEALAIYAIGGDKGKGKEDSGDPPLQQKDVELPKQLKEALDSTIQFMSEDLNFDINTIINAEGLHKIAAIVKGVDAVKTNDETRNRFGVLGREVFKKYKALLPDKEVYEFKARRDAINAIYSVIEDDKDNADITSLIKQVQDVVNESISSLNILLEPTEDYGKKIDLSGLDFERIEKDFLKRKNKNTQVQTLKEIVEQKLNRMIDSNPLRIDYYKKYQEIIEEYNQGKEYATVKDIFDRLILLYKELDAEDKRALMENMTEDALTVFDMLEHGKRISDAEKISLKDTAKSLLQRLQENEFKVNRWTEKTQTSSAVRKVINDYLFQHLPFPTYTEEEIASKTDVLYNFFKVRYGKYGIAA